MGTPIARQQHGFSNKTASISITESLAGTGYNAHHL